MTFQQFRAAGYLNELADRYPDFDSARQLLAAAEFPLARLPAFGSPLQFWTGTMQLAFSGLVANPLRVVEEALVDFPYSELFRRAIGLPLPAPPSASATVVAAVRQPPPPPVATVLFAAANPPQDTTQLDQQNEFRTLDAALAPAVRLGRARVEAAWAVRPRELLHLVNTTRPTVAYFSMHGEEGGRFQLDDGTGRASPIDALLLGNVFQALNHPAPVTRLVVLSCCYSERAAAAIAPAVDWVVGATDRLSDRAAHAFTGAFFGELGRRLAADPPAPVEASIRPAVEVGLAAVRAVPTPGKADDPNNIVVLGKERA